MVEFAEKDTGDHNKSKPNADKKRATISVHKKHSIQPSTTANDNSKFNLTPVQRVQVEIIDWKRCSVRSLLIICYVTLIHLIMYLIVLGLGYTLITTSTWLVVSFFGFYLDLLLYFFGSGAALKAVTYVWRPYKFFSGIVAIILAIILNLGLFGIGFSNRVSDQDSILPVDVKDFHCQNATARTDFDEGICDHIDSVEMALFFMPLILPPVAIICVVCAIISAYVAVYITPKKLTEWQVDAVWIEPYETYDFYVGRNIPRIPGYDDEHSHVNAINISDFYNVVAEDEDEEEDAAQPEGDATTGDDPESEPELDFKEKRSNVKHPPKRLIKRNR